MSVPVYLRFGKKHGNECRLLQLLVCREMLLLRYLLQAAGSWMQGGPQFGAWGPCCVQEAAQTFRAAAFLRPRRKAYIQSSPPRTSAGGDPCSRGTQREWSSRSSGYSILRYRRRPCVPNPDESSWRLPFSLELFASETSRRNRSFGFGCVRSLVLLVFVYIMTQSCACAKLLCALYVAARAAVIVSTTYYCMHTMYTHTHTCMRANKYT